MVFGVVFEPTQWDHATRRRLGLGWNNGIDTTLLKRCIDFPVCVAGVSRYGHGLMSNELCRVGDVLLDDVALLNITRRDDDIHDHTRAIIYGYVLLIGRLGERFSARRVAMAQSGSVLLTT